MELLTSVIATVLAAAVCAIARDSAPFIAEAIVRRASERLHPDIRETCEEEWMADIDRRGSSLAKIRAAVSFYLEASNLPQYDPAESSTPILNSVEIAGSGVIRITLRREHATHEYELDGDPVRALTLLQQNGYDDAASELERFLRERGGEKVDGR